MRPLVLVAALGLLGSVPGFASAQNAELARYQRAALRGMGRLEEPMTFQEVFKGKSPEEARAAGQQLAARGLSRLPAEDLKHRAELLLDFTGRADTKVCGRWAKGGATGEELIAMIAQLDSVALDGWVDLSLRSTVAEVRQTPAAFAGTQADIGKLFERLPTVMTAKESERFFAVMAKFDKASPKDACWFGRELYVAALALKPEERDHALRTLAWIEVQSVS
jgi:hypothetical protein